MRALAICSALLLTACGTWTSVVGPYRANISKDDVEAIKQLAQEFKPVYYNTLTLNSVSPNEVWVYTTSEGGNYYVDFVAVRRGGKWTLNRAKGSPPPPLGDGKFPRP